jgi:hypothetical protein
MRSWSSSRRFSGISRSRERHGARRGEKEEDSLITQNLSHCWGIEGISREDLVIIIEEERKDC